jgi:uncharacterized membrane protein YkvA (DUF1232 family)
MNLKERGKLLKKEIGTLYYAYKDERTPKRAKVLSIIVVSYALSPIDLIPDFIPILGYLDDVILLPLGILLVMKWLPEAVIKDARLKAEKEFAKERKSNYIVAGVILFIWLMILAGLIRWLVF